jgi:adenine-specific DNA-methyltransferase
MQGNNYQIDKEPLLNLPLINPTDKEMVKQIETLVDKIIHLKQTHGCSADTSDLEIQIDHLVYKLYNLTPKEIKIIKKFLKQK